MVKSVRRGLPHWGEASTINGLKPGPPPYPTPMSDGEFLIRWTIRLALLCYGSVLVWRLLSLPRRAAVSRLEEQGFSTLWLTGALLLGAHLVAAFHYYHHWSHRHALEDTARQTEELLGVPFGAGIYFSYLFGLLWLADALWWQFFSESYRRIPGPWLLALHAYLFFIAFNGAVVFEGGVTRWGGLAGSLVFAVIAVWQFFRWNRARSATPRTAAGASACGKRAAAS